MGVVNMNSVKAKNQNVGVVNWVDVRVDSRTGEDKPLQTSDNLEVLLKHMNIKIRYNEVSKNIEVQHDKYKKYDDAILQFIVDEGVRVGLNMKLQTVASMVNKLSRDEGNSYNPFIEYLENNKVEGIEEFSTISKVFDCIKIKESYSDHRKFYGKLFKKFFVDVIKMSFNEGREQNNGVLVFWGGQGTRKSTFCKELMRNIPNCYKGDSSLDPTNKDSVIQNTKYTLVELAELDGTLKGSQAKLKQFLTTNEDEIRKPYMRTSELHARTTSYIATVNKEDFLKDETGSRRFWVIPIEMMDVDKLRKIDINKFWGELYNLYLNGCSTHLDGEELEELNSMNSNHASKNDLSYIIEESFDLSAEKTELYNLKSICYALNTDKRVEVKNTLMRNFRIMEVSKSCRTDDNGVKRGFWFYPYVGDNTDIIPLGERSIEKAKKNK